MISEKPWTWDAVGRFTLGVIGAISMGMLFNSLVSSLLPGTSDSARRLLIVITTLVMELAVLGWVGFFLWESRVSINDAFGIRNKTVKAMAIGAGAALVALPVAWILQQALSNLMSFFNMEPEAQVVVKELQSPQLSIAQKVLFGIVAVLTAPIVEECIFRGIFYPTLKQGRTAFSGKCLKNMSALTTKLTQASDPLTAFIRSRLSGIMRDALQEYYMGQISSEDLRLLLVQELNDLLAGPSLYDPVAFAGVDLRPQTKRLLDSNPEGQRLVRLNRLLLEDAFPTELKRKGFPRLAMWITALIFGLVHANTLTFIPLTLLGVLLVLLYEFTDNLLASITAHSVFNAVNFIMLLILDPLTEMSKHIK